MADILLKAVLRTVDDDVQPIAVCEKLALCKKDEWTAGSLLLLPHYLRIIILIYILRMIWYLIPEKKQDIDLNFFSKAH